MIFVLFLFVTNSHFHIWITFAYECTFYCPYENAYISRGLSFSYTLWCTRVQWPIFFS